ncbi:hypothetical protein [Salinibaculum rarum]|uniref:hypothetical protein n=1 Tax=Salinibaculum rarum TaxID=3058903 RepID=UPI00265E43C4|nr:hypothetical protein [Salinibaculum sp. KK48]
MSQPSSQPDPEEGSASSDDLSQEQSQRGSTTRRRLLASGAAAWATVLAGCSGGGDNESPDETPSDDETPSPQPENYVVTAETGTGSEGVPESAQFVSACSATRRFVPGMHVIWYVGVYDPETGEQLTDEDLDAVNISINGETVELGWAGDDEENAADEWAGSWTIPEGTETGSVTYTVEITNGDANYRDVGILENSIEIIEYDDPSNYVVTTNTYWNGSPVESANGFVGGCAPERQFSQEMDVTFVIGIYDSTTGELVGSDTLDSVTISSADGSFDPVELSWQAGGEDSTAQWNGTLETENLDAGTYGYEVTVSDAGRDVYNVGIASAQFSIIEV